MKLCHMVDDRRSCGLIKLHIDASKAIHYQGRGTIIVVVKASDPMPKGLEGFSLGARNVPLRGVTTVGSDES